MRLGSVMLGVALFAGTAALWPRTAEAQCSVFSHHPCAPSVCSVFRHGACQPDYGFPIGEDLRLTVHSRSEQTADAADPPPRRGDKPDHDVDTLHDLFAALRACWIPPEQGHEGMSLSVRFAFRRNGEIIGTPRVTYMNREQPSEVREPFHDAVTAALERCTPMPLTKGLGGALAGRPIAIRFIDDRT